MPNDLMVCTHETILPPSAGVATPAAEFAALAALGVKGVRIGAVWAVVEPTQGKFTGYTTTTNGIPNGFAPVDAAIDAAIAAGLSVSLLLNTPRPGWATPQSAAAWANFCGKAAQRYAGKVTQFEIGNEWNIGANWDMGAFWAPGGYVASEIAQWIKAASDAINTALPLATIVSCGMAACIDWPNRWGARGPAQRSPSGMVADLLAAGVGPYIDKVGYHPYCLANDLSTWEAPRADHPMIQEILKIRDAFQAKNMAPKPIECTEWGWSTHDFSEATVGGYIRTQWDILHSPTFAPLLGNHFIYCGRDFTYPGATAQSDLDQREANFGLLRRDGTAKVGVVAGLPS